MSKIRLHRKFVEDLKGLKDRTHFRQIWLAVLDELFDTPNSRNDHRYKGLPNAWIRYVSRGNSALRIVFLRYSTGVVFYRGGLHSIEESISAPSMAPEELVDLHSTDEDLVDQEEIMVAANTILTNHEGKRIFSAFMGRSHFPTSEIFLISPFISHEILSPHRHIGKKLRYFKGQGCEIYVITRAEDYETHLDLHERLERSGIELRFLPNLHSKIYFFRTDRSYQDVELRNAPHLAIVGSSNLTFSGISDQPNLGNQEINYVVDTSAVENLYNRVLHMYDNSWELRDVKKLMKRTNNRRRAK